MRKELRYSRWSECILLISLTGLFLVRDLKVILDGLTLNQGVALSAVVLSIGMYLWLAIPSESNTSPSRKTYVVKYQTLILALGIWGMLLGMFMTWDSAHKLALSSSDHQALQMREVGLIAEGAGILALWSWWTFRCWGQSDFQRALLLHYPLSIALFALPWESVLRRFDQRLQEISTDIAFCCLKACQLTGIDQVLGAALEIHYWDAWTLYSDQFYLIINETCAGVNLLLSMSLYVLGYAWVMGSSLKRAWVLIGYMLPLCIIFNGLRVALIFGLGHFGDQELATGYWHEGTGYLCQVILFIVIALINQRLDYSVG